MFCCGKEESFIGKQRKKQPPTKTGSDQARQGPWAWVKARPLCFAALAYVAVLLSGGGEAQNPGQAATYADRAPVEAVGEVYKLEQKSNSFYVYLKDAECVIQGTAVQVERLLLSFDSQRLFRIGNRIQIKGKLRNWREARNPGQYDERAYYTVFRIPFHVAVEEAVVEDSGYYAYRNLLEGLRAKLRQVYELSENSADASVLRGMILGDKATVDSKVKSLYQEGGISHLLVISGLHISIVGMAVYQVCRRFLGFLAAGIASGCILASYCVMTGLGVSTVRALAMFLLFLGAQILGRTYDMPTALGAAALLLLLDNPDYLYYSGFQLSFGAILGILFVNPVIGRLLGSEGEEEEENGSGQKKGIPAIILGKCRRILLSGLAASVSIQIATLPVTAYWFYEINPYSCFLNMLILPLSGILIIFGLLGGIGGLINPAWAGVLLLPCRVILKLYEHLTIVFTELPGSSLVLGKPGFVQIVAYYTLLVLLIFLFYAQAGIWNLADSRQTPRVAIRGFHLFCRIQMNHKYVKACAVAMLFGIMVSVLTFHGYRGLRMTFLDVGQGDGIYLGVNNKIHILADCGSSDVKKVGEYRLLPFLKANKITNLDYIFLSHADGDHLSGILELLEGGYPVGAVCVAEYDNQDEAFLDFTEKVKNLNIKLIFFRKGDVLQAGDLTLRCLHPDSDFVTPSPNAASMVLQAEYGKFRALLTGDVEKEGEEALGNPGLLQPCNVLKVAHHGSKYSTQEPFLQAVQPQIAILSCGKGNSYGHPHRELLERLQDIGSKVYSTMEEGAIQIWTDGERVKMETYLGR